MSSDIPDLRLPTKDSNCSSPSNKRRRRSSESSVKTSELESSDNVPSSITRGSRTLKQPPTGGPSRDTHEMHRLSTPPESNMGAVKYTKTGRVSKAAKGQRVHHCEDCEKTYTRAEHLRRHKQNHKPGAYPCDVPGCSRSFHREDLLLRHKARHNDPVNPPSRRHSIGSQSSAADYMDGSVTDSSRISVLAPPTTTSSIVPVDLQASASRGDAERSNAPRPPKRVPVPPHQLHAPYPVVPLGAFEGVAPCEIGPYASETSPPLSPTGDCDYYDSPIGGYNGPPYYHQPHFARARHPSSVSYLGQYPLPASHSPVSSGSSTAYPPQWYPNMRSSAYHTGSTTPGGYGTYGISPSYPPTTARYVYDTGRVLTAEARDNMEQHDLVIPETAPLTSTLDVGLDATTFTSQQRYLAAYWHKVHALFPVIHEPTFDAQTASPLLLAALLALGGQALGDRADLANARETHEKCLKVLKKRTKEETHTYRPADMQAIVLVEIYSIFKSRRPPLQLSEYFLKVYFQLANDHNAKLPESLDQTPVDDANYFDDLTEATTFKLLSRCKQRLLLTCYIVDQQHAILFGRPQTAIAQGLGLNLPFPSSQICWDAIEEQLDFEYPVDTNSGRVFDALRPIPYMSEHAQEPYDTFRSMLLMACLSDPNNDLQTTSCALDETTGNAPVLFAVENSPRMRLAFHTFMLCKLTPVRDLLAVAGESWVMAEKLSSQDEYTRAQLEIRHWVQNFSHERQQPFIQHALSHACSILHLVRSSPRTGLLFQEWSAYLATIVFWANFYASNEDRQQPAVSPPGAVELRQPLHELDRGIATLLASTPSVAYSWTDTRNLILWTKASMARLDVPHTCGLVSGALDVLDKMVTRGNEAGWF